jgi:hypothetical protein
LSGGRLRVSMGSLVGRDSRCFLRRFGRPAAENAGIGEKVPVPVVRRGLREKGRVLFRTFCVSCLSSYSG